MKYWLGLIIEAEVDNDSFRSAATRIAKLFSWYLGDPEYEQKHDERNICAAYFSTEIETLNPKELFHDAVMEFNSAFKNPDITVGPELPVEGDNRSYIISTSKENVRTVEPGILSVQLSLNPCLRVKN